jgi:hypothetical protein
MIIVFFELQLVQLQKLHRFSGDRNQSKTHDGSPRVDA